MLHNFHWLIPFDILMVQVPAVPGGLSVWSLHVLWFLLQPKDIQDR